MFLKMVSPNRLVSLREQFLEELEEDLQKERYRQYSEEYRKALLERLEKGTLI
jgi:Arc/MetJ-type ribon-helix-helix transcriptional regulator